MKKFYEVGEKFEVDGHELITRPSRRGENCEKCYFAKYTEGKYKCRRIVENNDDVPYCLAIERKDSESVVFEEVEKNNNSNINSGKCILIKDENISIKSILGEEGFKQFCIGNILEAIYNSDYKKAKKYLNYLFEVE